MPAKDTATQLLDTAQTLVQERGFNAFSYKDLADAVGIRKASIHYHFETKAQLGEALMKRYLEALNRDLKAAESGRTAMTRLKKFVAGYRATNAKGLACVCGSLVSDIETLPKEVQSLVNAYLTRSRNWVANQIRKGADDGEFDPIANPEDLAALLVSGLQGALFVSRADSHAKAVAQVERAFWKTLEV